MFLRKNDFYCNKEIIRYWYILKTFEKHLFHYILIFVLVWVSLWNLDIFYWQVTVFCKSNIIWMFFAIFMQISFLVTWHPKLQYWPNYCDKLHRIFSECPSIIKVKVSSAESIIICIIWLKVIPVSEDSSRNSCLVMLPSIQMRCHGNKLIYQNNEKYMDNSHKTRTIYH